MNVSLCLCFKTSLRVKMSPVGANHMNGFAYLDSLWHRDKMQLSGNGLLDECRKRSWVKRRVKYSKIKILVKCDAEVLMSKYGWLLTPFTCRWLNSFSGKIILYYMVMYAPNNGCNVYLSSLFFFHISCASYVGIYFRRLFASIRSPSLGRSDF